jgi:hypothetical protein
MSLGEDTSLAVPKDCQPFSSVIFACKIGCVDGHHVAERVLPHLIMDRQVNSRLPKRQTVYLLAYRDQ